MHAGPPSPSLLVACKVASHGMSWPCSTESCCVWCAQYSYTGTATDRPLMDWLDHYTFPREAQMQAILPSTILSSFVLVLGDCAIH